ncbi:PAS domain S-box-containing protein/diguanylate cyclase (GGDEF) domain-containing protein [Nitrosomonas ureae]|uniref:PAS domain S-box-containing protein/diguanylate cyclase (GGDEF) domain-containing protein n=2 Tax=Nitrosomonas ureae TaxID=44577 RepID=A0A1H9AGN2_9PROT|nr:PAS domain S-box-containing protein/diguanylate cyclase (GGDEF) domain-containing protein [Nitrosomonas ureae]
MFKFDSPILILKQMKKKKTASLVFQILGVALLTIIYFATGKLGLIFPYMGSNITLFWPPAGIALAALMVWGFWCWPGIFLGALLVNLTTGDLMLSTASLISLGNTLGPISGAILLKQVVNFKNDFSRSRDLLAFILIVPGCMLLPSSLGVLALFISDNLVADQIQQAWLGWWFGDIVGIWIFAPLLLVGVTSYKNKPTRHEALNVESIFIIIVCVVIAWVVFGSAFALGDLQLSLAFLVFPPLIWACLRLGTVDAVLAATAISMIAAWGTAQGLGPFVNGSLTLDHFILCVFVATNMMIACSITGLQTARKNAHRDLVNSELRLRLALTAANEGLWDLNVQTGEVLVNPEYALMLGYSPHTFVETNSKWRERLHPEDQERVCRIYQEYISGLREDYQVEFRQLTQQGTWKWILSHGKLVEYDDQNRPLRMLGIHTDIEERKTREIALKRSEEALNHSLEELKLSEKHQRELRILAEREQSRMGALLAAMNIGILFEDNERRVEYVNPAFLRMWLVNEHDDLTGLPTKIVLEKSTERFAQPAHASKFVLNVMHTHEISERFELELSDGRMLTQLSYPVTDAEGRLLGRLWIYEDITQERQTAQQLLYLAERDPLTGLYNRHRFQEQLESLIANCLRSRGRFALLYFDLDDFKYINDTYGHSAGDTVLVRAAGEISSIIRQIEIFARLGGDEFAILSIIHPEEDINVLPSRIITAISSIPLRFHGRNIRLTSSLGVAIFPEHGETTEDLIAHADTAMYQAKNQGKNTWAIYDSARDDSEAMLQRMTWRSRIAQALEQDLFELHFQGVYLTSDKMLSHIEALIRMRDLERSGHLIMPGQFIPIAEKSGQILDIDRWVVKECIEKLANDLSMPPLAINISGRTFDEPSLPLYIRKLLMERGVEPGRLIIELTETAAVSDIQDAQRFIESIHQSGCKVCLDDFGSGFSTFGYLKYLGVEILKIDGLFITGLHNNRDNQVFVKAMVDVAHGLGKITVAEYVEDEDTFRMVKKLGIDLVQGYNFGRPSKTLPK